MRILFLAHAFNSLTQRLYVELTEAGHEVSIEFDVNDRGDRGGGRAVPAGSRRRAVPQAARFRSRCGARTAASSSIPASTATAGRRRSTGRSSTARPTWGVTALEANAEMDAGDVWASVDFPMRDAAKGSLYRNEVTEAAVAAMRRDARAHRARARGREPLDYARPGVRGRLRPPMRQADRAIDWRATTRRRCCARSARPTASRASSTRSSASRATCSTRIAKARCAAAAPGDVIAQRDGAILRATVDGAVWITHLQARERRASRVQAARGEGPRRAPRRRCPRRRSRRRRSSTTRRGGPIRYEEEGAVGCLHFPFYNGAMGTAQCEALRAAYALRARRGRRA